jgi:hypothetical protein
MATEYVTPDGRMVAWYFLSRPKDRPTVMVAARQATDRWVLLGSMAWHPTCGIDGWLARPTSLRKVRLEAIGGNGKRYGRHTSIEAVRTMTRVHFRALLARP